MSYFISSNVRKYQLLYKLYITTDQILNWSYLCLLLIPTMTLKFIHTKIRKRTRNRNHPERRVLLREGWMQQSCGEVRWWLMYHFVKEMCQKRAWQSFFHTLHNAHEYEWRINTVERGFLMAWNLWSIKSGSTSEFWGCGSFFPQYCSTWYLSISRDL